MSDALARVKAAVDPDAGWPDVPKLTQDLRTLIARLEAAEAVCERAEHLHEIMFSSPVDSAVNERRAMLGIALFKWHLAANE